MVRRDPTWKARPVPDYSQSQPLTVAYAAWIEVAPEVATRIGASPPRCVVSMDAFLVRPLVVATVALGHPNGESGDGARVNVQSSEMSYIPELKNTYLDASIVYDSAPNCPLQSFVYDSRGGKPGDVWENGFFSGTEMNAFPRADLGFISVHLPAGRLWRTDHWVEDPAWRPSARLVAVTLESAGSFNRVLQADRLVPNWGGEP
jgi:hypothetical protein